MSSNSFEIKVSYNLFTLKSFMMHTHTHTHIYIYIYIYGYCYIFLIQVYLIKLTYRAYTIQLKKNQAYYILRLIK